MKLTVVCLLVVFLAAGIKCAQAQADLSSDQVADLVRRFLAGELPGFPSPPSTNPTNPTSILMSPGNRVPSHPTPSHPRGPTPSHPGGPTPSYPGGPTPSHPGGPTPSYPRGPTPSQDDFFRRIFGRNVPTIRPSPPGTIPHGGKPSSGKPTLTNPLSLLPLFPTITLSLSPSAGNISLPAFLLNNKQSLTLPSLGDIVTRILEGASQGPNSASSNINAGNPDVKVPVEVKGPIHAGNPIARLDAKIGDATVNFPKVINIGSLGGSGEKDGGRSLHIGGNPRLDIPVHVRGDARAQADVNADVKPYTPIRLEVPGSILRPFQITNLFKPYRHYGYGDDHDDRDDRDDDYDDDDGGFFRKMNLNFQRTFDDIQRNINALGFPRMAFNFQNPSFGWKHPFNSYAPSVHHRFPMKSGYRY